MTKIRELKEILKADAVKIRELKKARKNGYANEISSAMFGLSVLRPAVRFKHIAYCLLRGRTYEQIEKPREPLKDKEWARIKEVQNEYTENVLASAA